MLNICRWLCPPCTCPVRIVPLLGPIQEQQKPVVKTPQYQRRKKGDLIMAFQMSNSQFTTLHVKFVDKKGQPAPVDGPPQWSTDNSDVLALALATDGMSCTISSIGPIGAATVTLQADADLGAGVTPIIGTLDVTITGGTAVSVTIDADPPTEQP